MSGSPSRVYLDHNATSPARPEAIRAVRAAMEFGTANPSSLHAEGRAARAILEESREQVAALAQVLPAELVFTSGGSEAIVAAVRGVCDSASARRRRLLVSAVEHSAVLDTAALMGRFGFKLTRVPCGRDGRVDPQRFIALLDDDVALAALQWANNETGVIQPVEDVGPACAAKGVPFLVDAVQALGKIEIDPQRAHADLVAMSGHKIGGPHGTGALAVREGLRLAPLIAGGAQERRRRGGTEAVAALAGFGAVARAGLAGMAEESARLLRLRAKIESRLRDALTEVRIHGEGVRRLPNTVNFAIPGVPGETLAIALDVAGFAVSTGSACASGSVKPSHVIEAMGFGEAEARGSIRVSLGWSTATSDVERFLDALPDLVRQVREGLKHGGAVER